MRTLWTILVAIAVGFVAQAQQQVNNFRVLTNLYVGNAITGLTLNGYNIDAIATNSANSAANKLDITNGVAYGLSLFGDTIIDTGDELQDTVDYSLALTPNGNTPTENDASARPRSVATIASLVGDVDPLLVPTYARVSVLGYHTAGDGGGGDVRRVLASSGTNNAGTFFTSTANALYAWERVSGDILSVKMFGAKGDGMTDDSAAWQAALDWAGATTVTVPAGDYLLTNTIAANRSLKLVFEDGARIVLQTSGLDYASLSPTGGNVHPAILNITTDDVTVSGFAMNGGTNLIAAIKVGDDNYTAGGYVTNVVISGGHIVSAGGSASSTDTVTLARVRGGGIYGVTFENCRGKSAAMVGCFGSVIQGCQMTGCEQSLYVGEISPGNDYSQACQIIGNVSVDATALGLKLSRSSLGTVARGNIFRQLTVFPSFYVVALSSSQDSIFSENVIYVQGQNAPSDEVVRIEPNTGAVKDSIRLTLSDNVIVVTNSSVGSLLYLRSQPGYSIVQPRIVNNSFINLGPTNQPLAISALTADSTESIVEPSVVGNYFEGFDLAIALQQTGSGPNIVRPMISGNTYSNVTTTVFFEADDPQSLMVGDYQSNNSGTNAVWFRAPESYGTNRPGPVLNLIGGRSTGSGAGGNLVHWIYGTGSSGTNLNSASRVGTWHSGGLTIGDANPTASFGLEVVGNGARFADTAVNNSTRSYRWFTRAYTDGNPSPIHSFITATPSDTILSLGGGTSAGAAIKTGFLLAAANTTTTTGSYIAKWSTSGFDVLSGGLTVNGVAVALAPAVETLTYSGTNVALSATSRAYYASTLTLTNDCLLTITGTDGASGGLTLVPHASTSYTVYLDSSIKLLGGGSSFVVTNSASETVNLEWKQTLRGGSSVILANKAVYP